MKANLTTRMRLLALLPLILLVSEAAAQSQDYHFHWSPCPQADDRGAPLPEAVEYEVWLRKGSGAEEKVGTVVGDTTFVLNAEPGVVQRIRVCGYDERGVPSEMSEWSDPVYFEANRSVPSVPSTGELRPNYPNPFNPETRIVYGIPEDLGEGDVVRLEIYALDGRRVRVLEAERTPGWHEVVWDGKDDRGQTTATGMYMTAFTCGTVVETNKMTMLK